MWAGAPVQAMQPRLLLCGPEGAGQRHLAPAVLYALEGLPVHALGLPALLSDASARCSTFPLFYYLDSFMVLGVGM